MANTYSFSNNTTGTAVSATIVDQKLSSNYAVKSATDRAVVLTNTKANFDMPESLTFKVQDIANIYSGSEISPALFAPTKKGRSVVMQLKTSCKIAAADAGTDKDIVVPINCWTVIQAPVQTGLSNTDLQAVANYAQSLAYNNATTAVFDGARLGDAFRGAINPIQ